LAIVPSQHRSFSATAPERTAAGPAIAAWRIALFLALSFVPGIGGLYLSAANDWRILPLLLACPLLVLFWIGWRFVLRPIDQLVQTAERWQAGDLGPRAVRSLDGTPFAPLGRALDGLADAMADRDRLGTAATLAERRMAGILESITDGLYEVDRDWRITFANDGAKAQFGGDADIIGATLWDIVPAGQASLIEPRFRHAMATRAPAAFDVHLATDHTWFSVRAYPTRDRGLTIWFRDVTAHRSAIEALRAGEARLRAILDTAQDAILMVDGAGTIRAANPGAERIFGRSPDSLIGQDLDVVAPRALGAIGAGDTRCEIEGQRADGTVFPLELSAAEWIEAGRPVYTCILRDTSDRQRARVGLQMRSLRLRLLGEMAAGLLEAERPEDVLSRFVDSAGAELGIDVCFAYDADARSQTLSAIFLHGIAEEDRAERAAVACDETICGAVVQARMPVIREGLLGADGGDASDDARRLGLRACAAFPLLAGSGRLLGVLAFGSRTRDAFGDADVSFLATAARQLAALFMRLDQESAMRSSELRFRTMADSIPQLAWMCDREGRTFWYNRRWYDYTGTTLNDVEGEGWHSLHHRDHVDRVVAGRRRSWTTGDPWEDTFPLRGADGRYRWFLSRALPVRDADGHIVLWFGTDTDVTDQREAEAALATAKDAAERANLSKTKFLAAASHDLRQPMQSLFFLAGALRRAVPAQGRGMLDQLENGLDTLKDLLDSLLDMSRLDAGIVLADVRDVGCAEVLARVDAAFAPVAAQKGLGWHVAADVATLRTDPTLLGRILRNLVENAIRYTTTGEVRLTCRHADDGRLWIDVTDTGPGIPPDHLDRIWEEFHQVGNSERDRTQGLGLGLAIVRRLAELLGMTVDVQSRPGGGSVFSVGVPIGDPTGLRQPLPEAPAPRKARRIMVIEDDAIVRLGLQAVLQDWGDEVILAGSADEAVARLEAGAGPPDVIIADYRLRDGHIGTAAILRVRDAVGRKVPGVLLTGETSPAPQEDAARHDLVVACKPIGARELGRILNRVMRAP
jgi:two-component system, sensor histidine kinase